MKRSLSLLAGILLLSGCSYETPVEPEVVETTEVVEGVFLDEERGVRFEYPSEWDVRETEYGFNFGASFLYLDGLSESSAEDDKWGRISYGIQENPDELSLEDYYTQETEKCLNELPDSDPSAEFYGLEEALCSINLNILLDSEPSTLQGHEAYTSGWEGIPESGEAARFFWVNVPEKKIIITITAVKTGQADEVILEEAFELIHSTLTLNQ